MTRHLPAVDSGGAPPLNRPQVDGADEGASSRGEFGPLRGQLLKWIGNKQRFAAEITACFPGNFGTYWEPFVGSGAVLATLAPRRAVAGDVLAPLVELWRMLAEAPDALVAAYRLRWQQVTGLDADDPASLRAAVAQPGKAQGYRQIRDAYNANPNGADLLFLSRSCYGGVIRFTRAGAMNTPCGAHRPIHPDAFRRRVRVWQPRVAGARFEHSDFEVLLDRAQRGDLVYCDPPYGDSEGTLYGAQGFQFQRLVAAIVRCKARGVHVVLSIDGTKRSGRKICALDVPEGLFEQEAMVNCGRSMLRRFQMEGQTLEHEVVADRLLLTWA